MFDARLVIEEMEAIRQQAQKLDKQAARVINMLSSEKPKKLSFEQQMKQRINRRLDLKFNK